MGKIRDVGIEIAYHLDQVEKLFKPGRRMALVSWHPSFPERDMVMIQPGVSMAEVIEVVQRRMTAPDTLTIHTLADEPVEGCDCDDCRKVRGV